MQGSQEIGRSPDEAPTGGFAASEPPWQADIDERLAAFRRATADQQRRLGLALADALSAITHRVDRIEREPSLPAGIELELAGLRSTLDGLASRKDLLALQGVIARIAADQIERDELLRKSVADLVRKLDAVAEARSPARLEIAADRLAATAARLKDFSAAPEGPDTTLSRLERVQETLGQLIELTREPRGNDDIAALREELVSLKAAQAATDLRLAEGVARIEAALSRAATVPLNSPPSAVSEETDAGLLRRTFLAVTRRSADLRRPRTVSEEELLRKAGVQGAGPAEATGAGTDLPRPLANAPQRALAVLGGGAVILGGLLYLASSTQAPEAPPTAAAAVVASAEAARVAVKSPIPVASPALARRFFSAADHAALEELADRLMRGETMVRDDATELPAGAQKPITGNSRS